MLSLKVETVISIVYGWETYMFTIPFFTSLPWYNLHVENLLMQSDFGFIDYTVIKNVKIYVIYYLFWTLQTGEVIHVGYE